MSIDDRVARIQAELPRLTPVEAYDAVRRSHATIVDTRPEYQRQAGGEVPGAIIIERNHLEWRLDPASTARIPEAVSHDIHWIVICEAGYSSSLAAHSLRELGIVHTTDIAGGFQAWQAARLPVDHPEMPTRARTAPPAAYPQSAAQQVDDGYMTSTDPAEGPSSTKCWCCDRDYDERDLVRLGAHPEVGICLACAVDVKQRAVQREDELRPTAVTRLRTGVRRCRDWVITHDWHNRPVLGQLLRRINRYLP